MEIGELQKRDIQPLTFLFQTLNNSATISLAKTALQLSLTRDQVCNFVGTFIQSKGLQSILESADQSGLALDLVLMILTHYETVDGLIDVIDYGKKNGNSTGESCTPSLSGSSGLLGGLLNGVTSILGLGSSDSSSSTCSSSNSGLPVASPSIISGGNSSGNSSNNTPSPSSSNSASTSSGSGGGIIGNIIGGIGSIFGLDLGGSNSGSTGSTIVTSKTTTAGTGTASASFTTTTSAPVAIASTFAITTLTPLVPEVNTIISTPSVTPASSTIRTNSPAATTSTSTTGTPNSAGSPGDLISGIANGIGGLISGIFGREDLAEIAEKEGLMGVMKRDDVDEKELMHQLLKRALDENLTLLQKRDALSLIYSQIIAIIGTDSNIEEIFESLAKSGLAINVVYNALTDSGFYQFDVQLYNYLVNNGYISLKSAVDAALSSGLVAHIVSDFVANSTYLKLVINFILAIFTGGVNVFGLITAIF